MRDVRRQSEARRSDIQLGRTSLTQGLLVGGAILPPEVDLPAERRLQIAECLPTATVWRRDYRLLRESLSGDTALRIDLWKSCRLCDSSLREGRTCARLGHPECRAPGETFRDQLIQLGILKLRPPLGIRPRIGADGGAGQSRGRLQRVRLAHGGLRCETVSAGAS